jgi:hypothetical protein
MGHPVKKVNRPGRVYTDKHIDYVRSIAKGRFSSEITRMFNRRFRKNVSEVSIGNLMQRNDIQSGVKYRWKNGHVPHNKGQKRWWSGGESTQFKRGNTPPQSLPVGTVRKEDGILKIKIQEPKKWVFFHHAIYEYFNGPVSDGHIVIFGDGNQMNYSPDNLIMVSRAQLGVMNQKHMIYSNADLTKIGALMASVKIAANKRKQKLKDRKVQDVKAKHKGSRKRL